MEIRFQKLDDRAILPQRATAYSAGMDLHACLAAPVTIAPGQTVMVPLGLAAQPTDPETALLIFPRSGLSSRYGITLANAVGVVDSDYRGEWMVPLHNLSDTAFTVEHGMRVAQLVVVPVIFADAVEAQTLDETARGAGGFGSSGLR